MRANRVPISIIIAWVCAGRPTAAWSANELRTRVTSTLKVAAVPRAGTPSDQLAAPSELVSCELDQACTTLLLFAQPCGPPCVQRLQALPNSHTLSWSSST